MLECRELWNLKLRFSIMVYIYEIAPQFSLMVIAAEIDTYLTEAGAELDIARHTKLVRIHHACSFKKFE